MKQTIRAFVSAHQKEWDDKLNHLIYAYRFLTFRTVDGTTTENSYRSRRQGYNY